LHFSHFTVGPGDENRAPGRKNDLDWVIPILIAAIFPEELPHVVI
jgi:hypothetical protein